MVFGILLLLIHFLQGNCSGSGSGQDQATGLQPHTLYVLSLLPYPDPTLSLQPSWDEGQSVFLAEQLAVEHINNRSDILPGFRIELIQANGGCNVPSVAMESLITHVFHSGKQIVGIIGPGCSSSAIEVSSMTPSDQIALVNFHLGTTTVLSNRTRYPYSFGIAGGGEGALSALLTLVEYSNWTRSSILFDESRPGLHKSNVQLIVSALEQNQAHRVTFSSAVYEYYIPFDAIEQERVRIVILLVGSNLLPRILCLAHHRGFLFPDYQMIIPFEVQLRSTVFMYEGRNYFCDEDTLWKSSNGHIFMTSRVQASNQSHTNATGYSYDDFNDLYELKVMEYNKRKGVLNITQSYWGPAMYDAVWALALALNYSTEPQNTLAPSSLSGYTLGQPEMTEFLKERIEVLEFEGISGRITFDNLTGFVQREFIILLYSPENRILTPVGYFGDNLTVTSMALQFIPDSFEEDKENPSLVMIILTALFLFLMCLELVVLVVAQILSISHRHLPAVKASSPKLNHLAFTGCYCLLLTTAAFMLLSYISISSFSCALRHFVILTFTFGGALIFAVVLARTWRLYRILVHFIHPGRFISDYWLITFTVLISGGGLLLNFIWVGVDPYQVRRRGVEPESCEAKLELLWVCLCVGYCSVITLLGAWYAVRCHNVPTPRKEFQTTNVIFLAYANILIQAIGFPIYFLSIHVDLLAFVTFCLVDLSLVLSSFMLLFPPVWPILKNKCLCNVAPYST